jgi:pantoate--beta-alanine ligase
MGALHEGHLSLIRASRHAGDVVVVSIFVNPTQFGAGEDYQTYPRTLETDLHLCETERVRAAFVPDVEAMYRPDAKTKVHVAQLTDHLCGPCRPGHFDGVALVVTKLFNIVQPDRAYFGQKDAQQLAVIRALVEDLNLPIQIVACPTARQPDGLARSSRNILLSDTERSQATVLYAGLRVMRELIAAGERDAVKIVQAGRNVLEASGPCQIDYVEVVDSETLQPLVQISGRVLAAVAVRIGACRLIDNLLIDTLPGGD